MQSTYTICSNYGSISSLPLKKWARNPLLLKYGWNSQNLIRFIYILQTILQKYENYSAPGQRFKLRIAIQNPKEKELIAKLDEQKNILAVYLQAGPAQALKTIPGAVSFKLAELWLNFPARLHPGKSIVFREDAGLINSGIDEMIAFFSVERGIKLDRSAMGSNFENIVRSFGRQIVKIKLSFDLMKPAEPSRDAIEDEAEAIISRARQTVAKPQLDADEVSIWVTVAHLAMFSVIARKTGCIRASFKCQSAVNSEALAMIELLKMHPGVIEHFQKYPFEVKRQIGMALPGFNLLFNIFSRIFEAYYDSAAIKTASPA